jgi:hypothetical protein
MCFVEEHLSLHTCAKSVCNLCTIYTGVDLCAMRLLLYSMFGRVCLRHSCIPAGALIAACLFNAFGSLRVDRMYVDFLYLTVCCC